MAASIKTNSKTLVLHIVTYFFTALVIYLILRKIGVGNVLGELKRANTGLVIIAFSISLLSAIFSGLKLKLLAKLMGYKISFARCQMITFGAFSLNVVLPSKGGDFAKAWSLSDTMPLSHGAGLILLDRLIDLCVLCQMSLVGSILIANKTLSIFSGAALVLVLLAICVLSGAKDFDGKLKLLAKFKEIGHATKCITADLQSFFLIVCISVFIWLVGALQIYILYMALEQQIPLSYSFAVVPIAILVGMLPITIAGMGTRDLVIVKLFSNYATASASISIGLLFSFLRYWILALIGLFFIGSLRPKKKTPFAIEQSMAK